MATPAEIRAATERMQAIVEAASGRVEKALGESMRRAVTRISGLLAQREEWSIVESEALVAQIRGALEDAGVYDVSDNFGAAARAISKTAAGIAPLAAEEGNILAAALRAKYTGWEETVDQQVIGWIRDRMAAQSVEPIQWRALADEIADQLDGPAKRYAMTYAETAVNQVQRDAWIATGESLGAEYWRWDGPPPIDTSHEECIENWDKVFTRDELVSMGTNSTGLPTWPTLGGLGCRHTPTPVDPVTAKAERGE